MTSTAPHEQDWDIVIVGSGAGGGTLAARLAERGQRVFLLEAGGDAPAEAVPGMPEDHDIPAFHPFASENPAMRWDFRVRHYADARQQARDWKSADGTVLYPRAATLGGCTAHNAMIFMLPHDSDWDAIAQLTGDESWRASAMRRYARRVENCRHRPFWRALAALGIDPLGHGWHGWLHTERAMPLEAFFDFSMLRLIFDTTAIVTLGMRRPLSNLWRALRGRGDPNARRLGGKPFEGACYTPLSTSGHKRVGARERLLAVRSAIPIACTSSSTRWPRASCSTTSSAPSASNTARAGTCTAPTPSRATRASCDRCARVARSCCAAARSTRRSC